MSSKLFLFWNCSVVAFTPYSLYSEPLAQIYCHFHYIRHGLEKSFLPPSKKAAFWQNLRSLFQTQFSANFGKKSQNFFQVGFSLKLRNFSHSPSSDSVLCQFVKFFSGNMVRHGFDCFLEKNLRLFIFEEFRRPSCTFKFFPTDFH